MHHAHLPSTVNKEFPEHDKVYSGEGEVGGIISLLSQFTSYTLFNVVFSCTPGLLEERKLILYPHTNSKHSVTSQNHHII